jgi:predicted Zn-dependent protease with MMP-like domain
MQPIDEDRFSELVGQALDDLPDELFEGLENVAVVVEDENPEDPELLGLYEGVPLTDRWDYSAVLPDRIAIYRLPLCRLVEDEEELVEEVQVTVVHELAHHMGIDEDHLHELGWG